MTAKAERKKAELIDKVVASALERLDAARASLAERFIRQFYAHVPPDDIVSEHPDNLYGAALSLWELGQSREVGTAKVRVHNPRPEEQGWRSSHTIVEIVNDDMPFLVDSVTAELTRLGVEVYLAIHPIVRVTRSPSGDLTELSDPETADEDAARESLMHVQISEQPAKRLAEIRDRLDVLLPEDHLYRLG